MGEKTERDYGAQPIVDIISEAGLKPHDLVTASAVPMTHKMVARACKGRWLTPNTRAIVLAALNAATGRQYTQADLFTYE